VFVSNVRESLEEAFGEDVGEGWKKIWKLEWPRRKWGSVDDDNKDDEWDDSEGERELWAKTYFMGWELVIIDICYTEDVCWLVEIPWTCCFLVCSYLVKIEMVYLADCCFVSLGSCCYYVEILNYKHKACNMILFASKNIEALSQHTMIFWTATKVLVPTFIRCEHNTSSFFKCCWVKRFVCWWSLCYQRRARGRCCQEIEWHLCWQRYV